MQLLDELKRGKAYVQEQTDTSSQTHLYANSAPKSPAMLTVRLGWRDVFWISGYDGPQGFTWSCAFGFMFMVIDAITHSS